MATQKDVNDYLNENSGILTQHVQWHTTRHSGSSFLKFHGDIIAGFEKWLKNKKRKELQQWIPQANLIESENRQRFIDESNILKQSKQKLQQKFANKNELGSFIQGGVHVWVHDSFKPIADGGNGIDSIFATFNSPHSIRFWTWHKWINNVQVRSGLK